MAVAALHEDRPEIVFQQVQPHGVGSRVPDARQLRVVAIEPPFVVDRFGLADKPYVADDGGLPEAADVYPPEADAFVELPVQLQPEAVAVASGDGGFHRVLRAGVEHGRFVELADAGLERDVGGVAVEFEPSGVHLAEVEHQVACVADGDPARVSEVGGFGVRGRRLPGVDRVYLQPVVRRYFRPAVAHQRVGRFGYGLSRRRGRKHGVGFRDLRAYHPLRRLGLERRCEEQGDGGKAGRGIHGGLLTYFERYQGNGGQ